MEKVLLGMSGGVDSSVAAFLLKKQGYDVIGVTMKLFNDTNSNAVADAQKVCEYLNIPHYVINLIDEFKTYVIDNFVCEYSKCHTPNPCVECNKYLKFGIMYKKAQELGCNYIATGHYAKIEYDDKFQKKVLKKSNSFLKDQTYFLYNLKEELLDHILFPLGEFESKNEIRKIAIDNNLPVANKPDSEDICFIPNGDYKYFLENKANFKGSVGNIVNKNGDILGKHSGLYQYTIGQRKGLGISNETPLYVVGFNNSKSELIVGEEKELYTKECTVSKLNFIPCSKLEKEMYVDVKTRFSKNTSKAWIVPILKDVKVVFDEPARAITPGQSAVFYDNDVVICGGIIQVLYL